MEVSNIDKTILVDNLITYFKKKEIYHDANLEVTKVRTKAEICGKDVRESLRMLKSSMKREKIMTVQIEESEIFNLEQTDDDNGFVNIEKVKIDFKLIPHKPIK